MNGWRPKGIKCTQKKPTSKILSLLQHDLLLAGLIFTFVSLSFSPWFMSETKAQSGADQDFAVQRGTTFVSGTSTTLYAGSDYQAPNSSSSALIRITNTHLTGAGRSGGDSTQNADDVTAYIENPENITDSITISRPDSAVDDTRVSWEILEYVGMTGADNEMIVRDQGTVSYGSADTNATGSVVSNVSDDSDVAIFITGQENEDSNLNYHLGMSISDWDVANQVPVFTRGDSGSVSSLSYAVVEFVGPNWDIQKVEHDYTSAGTVETESIDPISSLSRAFLHAQKMIGPGETSLNEIGHEVWLSSIGAVSFQVEEQVDTPSLHRSVAWVIANTQTGTGAMDVQRSNGVLEANACSGTEPCAETIGLTEIVPENASIWASNYSSSTGNAFPAAMLGVRLLSNGTEYEFWRSDTSEDQTFRTEVVEWPVAETVLQQNYYRFYANNGELDPIDPWPPGAFNLGENTSITGNDDPLGEGEVVRLRMSIAVSEATLPENGASFKLQYAPKSSTCSAIGSWNDLGAPGSGVIWRGYDGAVADGTNLATSTPAPGTLNLSVSDVAGTYEKQNNTASNTFAVATGEDIEYDWAIQHNGADQFSDYCFRMVHADGTELDDYNNYPTLQTTGYTPLSGTWRWYDDESSLTPSSPLATEDTAAIDIVNKELLKLRVVSHEVENATGENVKFALQFSEYSDFSDGGRFVVSTSSCTGNSLWCYADGAGVDNDVIEEKVLSTSDTCTSGSGAGCGTHNEAATTSSTFTHLASTSPEFEFTLRQAGARANAVYYFRLFAVGTDEPVETSSSYPSLVTEGPQLVATISGIPAGTTVAGVTSDATTTPTSIGFGSLPVGSSREAIQRINVDTNATEGYQVLMYATQQLTNSYGDIIPAITNGNESPGSWKSGCSEDATGCFGYHTTDATLANASGRFAPIDSYAALDTDPKEVMHSSIPQDDTQDLVYRVLVNEDQPAGDYQTSIVYIAIPTF